MFKAGARTSAFVFFAVFLSTAAGADEVELRQKPCRILDTRMTAEGPIGAGSSRPFALYPSASIAQGGAVDCGIPAQATGVKLIVKGVSTGGSGGYFKVYNGGTDQDAVFTSLNLQPGNQFSSSSLDLTVVPVARVAAIFANVESHAVVEVVGWYLPCVPEDSFELSYSQSQSSIQVPAASSTDLSKYGPAGRKIWVGGAASQPGLYTITGVSSDGKKLFVSPTPQTATDVALEVHLLSGGCSPREVVLDGPQ